MFEIIFAIGFIVAAILGHIAVRKNWKVADYF
jgi:hypothetical protein